MPMTFQKGNTAKRATMERSSTSDRDTTSETDVQKKTAADAQPLVVNVGGVPIDTTNSTNPVVAAAAMDDAAVQRPRKKRKVQRKPPPAETTTINLSEESKVPTPMGATSVYGSGLLPETSLMRQNESRPATMLRQMEFMFSSMPASSNAMVTETAAGLPISNILHRLGQFQSNETMYPGITPRIASESITALVASLPTSSLPFQQSSMSAAPTGSPFQFGSPSRPPEPLSYWSRFGPEDTLQPRRATLATSMTHRFPQGFQTMETHQFPQGYHASDIYRSPVAGPLPRNANYFGLQDNSHSALASSSQYAASPNTGNSMDIGTLSLQIQLQRTANRILEDMIGGRQDVQDQNPAVDALMALANGGNASTQQQRLSVSTTSPRIQLRLPAVLGQSSDILVMNEHQAYLRQQIEVFEATQDDIYANSRGRNRAIHVGQVGIRCRHCAHIPRIQRQSSTVYYPARMRGLYQAAQNLSTNHIQCGLCTEMPECVKTRFIELWSTKNNVSSAGRSYWEENARLLGLVDTDNGIAFQPNPST